MGQQHKPRLKRARRKRYLKRKSFAQKPPKGPATPEKSA